AQTKWNFLPFTPGLVGGHCIGVDPYYLTHKARSVGYDPQVILAGRHINDSMSSFIAEKTAHELRQAGHRIEGAIATVLGLTFKENCKDIRNSKVADLIHALQARGIRVQVHDPLAHPEDAQRIYGLALSPWKALQPAQALIAAVPHAYYRQLPQA